MRLRAYLLMTLVVATWGTTFVVVKAALADASPGTFNLARMFFAFLVLFAAYPNQLKSLRPKQILAGAIVGLCLALGYQFQTIGLARTTPSKSAFITGLVVVLVPLFTAIPFLRLPGARSLRWNAWLGATLAFLGIIFLTAPAAASGIIPNFSSINLGDLLTLGCAIGFTFHCLALGHVSPRIGFRPLAILQVGFCALFMAASLPFLEHPTFHLTLRLAIALSVSAILSTAIAFSVQSWAQTILPPTHTALIMTLEPVFAWITAYLFIGERFGTRQLSGALLILAGICLTELIPQPHVPSAHEG
jgi:drug/metabolite transporter (DMT)-like permease